jgi:hypothetical protein
VNTLVESQAMASTPSRPSSSKRASEAGAPITGAGSSLKSPVWRISPFGVRIASAIGSSVECVTGMNSTENGPACTGSPGAQSFTALGEAPSSCSLRRAISAVKRVA